MNTKKSETKLNKIKCNLKNYSWFLWLIPLFLIVSYSSGIETGFFICGLMISGVLLGGIIPVIIGALFKKYDLKIIYGEIVIFIISTILLCSFIPDKKLLLFMIPFSIPLLIIGILELRK